MHPRILKCALLFLTVFFTRGTSLGQSLYDVVASLSDRQRVVNQQNQVGRFLWNQNNDPTDTDHPIPGDYPIDWQGVGTAPAQAAVDGLGIGEKITLLNQAIAEFDSLKFDFLNSSPGEFTAGSTVGALRPHTTRDFDPLPRATPENYNELLRLLAQRVRALRLLQWPSAFRQKQITQHTYAKEVVVFDDPQDANKDNNKEPRVEIRDRHDAVVTSATWADDIEQIGSGATDVEVINPSTSVASSSESHVGVFGTYNEDSSTDVPDPLRTISTQFQGNYSEEARISATAPGGAGTQIAGTVYILRRSHWHKIDISGASTKFEETNAGYLVEGSGNSGTVALFDSPPAATVNGSWVLKSQYSYKSGNNGFQKTFVEGGYQHKEASVLPPNDPGYSNDYNNSYEKNWKIGCTFFSIFKPTFTRGVDAAGMLSKLESADGILADSSADGELLLHPRPSQLFGIRLGPGLEGAGNGYLTGGSVNSGWYPSSSSFDWWGQVANPLVRFDSSYSLQLAGSHSDYHVVYENDRSPTGRAQSLPPDSLGWFYSVGGTSRCDTTTLYSAWDSPRLKQIAGRDLVADVTYNTNHYGGYTVRIYRRSTVEAAPTPGQLLDVTGMTLIRTWTFSHTGGENPHPNDNLEKLDIAGNAGEKYEIQAHQFLPDQGLGLYNVGGYGFDWWWDWEGSYSWTLKLLQGTGEKLKRVIEIENDDTNGNWVTLTDSLDGQETTTLSSMTLDPFTEEIPADWMIESAGKTIIGTATFDTNNPASGYGKWPTSVSIDYDGIQPNDAYTWGPDGLLTTRSQGPWTATGTATGDTYALTTKLNGSTCATTWTEFLSGGNKVKTYSAPDGNAGSKTHASVAWSEIEYGTASNGLPGLPHIVKNSDGTGASYGWNVGTGGSYTLTLEQGKLTGNTVSGGAKIVSEINAHGHPNTIESYVTTGGSLQSGGSVFSDFTAWGMPQKSTDYSTGLDTTWNLSNNLSRLASCTSDLGVVSNFSGYDVLGRPATISNNGISATNTYNAFSTSATISGSATGTLTETRDNLGRLTASNATWNGVTDNLGITPGVSSDVITRQNPLGTHTATLRKNDGTLTAATSPTLPFGGTAGTTLTVNNGLLKSTTALDGQSATYQTIWTDAWGRVRKTETPTASGTGTTEFLYSDPDSSLKRARVTEPTGRKLITESDPYNAAGAITRSGIDKDGNGALGETDRFVESITAVSGTKLVTILKLTEDSGLREILRTEWDPTGNEETITQINGGEETITRYKPKYTAKTVTTSSSKGWSKTESFNNLGLTTNCAFSGPGIPTASLTPTWRADGSLAGVSFTAGGDTHSATFNNNGTLANLTGPNGNIPVSHNISISNGVETLTVDGVTNIAKLDGTQHSISGADIIGKTDTLAVSGNGYQETIDPAVGSDTTTDFNAAGAATAKNYAAGAGEGYGYQNGLPHTVTLARGGELTYGYSNDGAKDLTSATWPIVASGDFTIPAITESYGYDRAGRIDEIGDASGVRTLGYQTGRYKETTWISGALRGYQLIKSYDGGRETGFTLKRDGVVIHSATKAPNGVSNEVSELASGNVKIVIGRNAARQITGFQWGNASGTFVPVVSQSWPRGTAGRILSATSSVSGSPSFNYKGTANDEATAFDAKGRRLKCATAGGEWTYQYTNGRLTSAVHPTLGSFSYHFDGIGRRTDKGSANTTDLLNQTTAWINSQNKTLKVTAHPAAQFWFNGTQIPNFTGSYNYSIPSPGASGGWVAWNSLAVLPGQGDAGANPDAKAEQSGAVWVPPISENFEYDNAGNRQNNALWDFGWDAKNQLVRARTKNHKTTTTPQGYDITNAYDAEGKRFSKKIKRYQNGSVVEQKVITFLYDGDDIIYEREQYPSGLTTCERKYVWGPDISGTQGGAGGAGGLLLIQETKGNSTIDLYPLYDGSGNVVALTDNTGDLQAEYGYGPFGELLYARGPHAQSCPFRFQTKYYDQETGLCMFTYRPYEPLTAQWLSRDPAGEKEDINLYQLTGGDPINYLDVDGLWRINTQEAANDQRVEWLLMQLSAGSGLPTAPLDEWKLYFPESGDFGLHKPYGPEDYKRAQTFVQNLGRPSIRSLTSEQAEVANRPSFRNQEWIPSATAALTLGAANTPLNASINSDWLLPTGAGAAGAKLLFGGMKAMLPLLATGARTEGQLLTTEMRAKEMLSSVAKLDYVPTSAAVLQGQAGRTSTILGSYQMDMKHIIAEMGNVKSLNFGAKPGGFNVLNVPDNLYRSPSQFWSQYNHPWLDKAVSRGDNFIFATKPDWSVFTRPNAAGKLELSGFGKEYLFLRKTGFPSQLGN